MIRLRKSNLASILIYSFFLLLCILPLSTAQQRVLYGLPPLPLTEEELATSTEPTTTTAAVFPFRIFTLPPLTPPSIAPPVLRFDTYGINPVPELPPLPESKYGGYYDNDGNFVKYGSDKEGQLHQTGRKQALLKEARNVLPKEGGKRSRRSPGEPVPNSGETAVNSEKTAVHSWESPNNEANETSVHEPGAKLHQAPIYHPGQNFRPTQVLAAAQPKPAKPFVPSGNFKPAPQLVANQSARRTINTATLRSGGTQLQAQQARVAPATLQRAPQVPTTKRLNDLAPSNTAFSANGNKGVVPQQPRRVFTGTARTPTLTNNQAQRPLPKRYVPSPRGSSSANIRPAQPLPPRPQAQQYVPQRQPPPVQQVIYRPQYVDLREPEVQAYLRDLEEYDWRLYYKEQELLSRRYSRPNTAPRASGDRLLEPNTPNSDRLLQFDADAQEVERRETFLNDPPQLHVQLPPGSSDLQSVQTAPVQQQALVPLGGGGGGGPPVPSFSQTGFGGDQQAQNVAFNQQQTVHPLFQHHFAVTPHPLFSHSLFSPHPLLSLFGLGKK